MAGYMLKAEPKPTKVESVSTMNQTPSKASGMPLASKIIFILFALGIMGYFTYAYVLVKVPAQPPATAIAPIEKPMFYKGEVIVVKSKDFKDIGLFLESDMTKDEYQTTLWAVATIPSTALVIHQQELTYKASKSKMKVYKCQVSKGVLMGKVVTISKTPM